MADNIKNDGSEGDFDEDFDVEDFSENDFDETAFDESELADLPEGDFADEDFADEEWQDDEGAQPDESLLTTGKKKGLSFNTIVIIGAVVVGGGVMAMTIMNKSAEQAASGQGFFQSILDISGVMDGDFFGVKEEEKTPEELAAQQLQTQNEGFLNNPDVVVPPTTPDASGNPPQPTPIAPPEESAAEAQPLTPMPEAAPIVPSDPDAMPRGPEDGAPESNVAIAEMPIEQAPAPSAEDILKNAMANRQQKTEDAPASIAEEPAADVPPREVVAAAEPTPAPAPVAEEAQSASPDVIAKNTEALEALNGRLDEMFRRMEQMESDLNTVKEAKPASVDTQPLEDSIAALKNEVSELKNRPAPVEKVVERIVEKAPEKVSEPVSSVEETAAEAPKPKAVPKKASKPKPAPVASSPARYELRAAQPGRAWVSKAGERDMQSVEVGQTLSGIGRVTAILYQNGRWTVQGTSGQINQ